MHLSVEEVEVLVREFRKLAEKHPWLAKIVVKLIPVVIPGITLAIVFMVLAIVFFQIYLPLLELFVKHEVSIELARRVFWFLLSKFIIAGSILLTILLFYTWCTVKILQKLRGRE